MTADTWEAFIARLLGIGVNAIQGVIRIALIVAIAYIVTQLLRAGLKRLEAFLISATARREDTALATTKRIRTLSSVIWTLACGLLWFIVALMALSQIGVNIGPILAGAGVVAVGVGTYLWFHRRHEAARSDDDDEVTWAPSVDRGRAGLVLMGRF